MTDIRISLTDKTIAQLPASKDGWYLARDTELKGFFVVIGKRKRTFAVQGDLRRGGKCLIHQGLRWRCHRDVNTSSARNR